MSVAASLESLPDRFRGSDQPATRFRVAVGKLTRDVIVDRDECRVEAPSGVPHVEICTDAATWREMDAGRLSGIEAFADRRLVIRGSIERSLHFEPSFERPAAGGLRYTLDRVRADSGHMSTLISGDPAAPPLVLIHGLGATKASWLTVVPQLARHYRVIAFDMLGFGASAKPLGQYSAKWFARQTFSALDRLGYSDVFIAGNSMGGRIAMEMAMTRPRRVRGIACLCPAAAFSYRPYLGVVKLLRPELGVLAGRLPRNQLKSQLTQLFADPNRLEESWYEAAIDDFLQVWKSPRARLAFLRAARNIYLDEPEGENGFWSRLGKMETPALFFYGKHDVLITHHFAAKVRRHVPHAKVLVWKDCGHVPQIEFPDRTASAILDFFGTGSVVGRERRKAVAVN